VRQDSANFGVENTDELTANRNFQLQHLFDGERESMLLVHRRDVVEAIEIRNGLKIGLRFDQLFGAAVQEADMRIDALDDFAIELEHQTQNAVRGRVLRSEVDRKVANVMFSHSDALRAGNWHETANGEASRQSSLISIRSLLVSRKYVIGAFPRGREIEIAEFLLQLDGFVDNALGGIVVTHLDITGRREVLAQRMAFETIVRQQTAQVGMAGEWNAVHVPGFALEPLGTHVDRRRRRNGYAIGNSELDADAQVLLRRQEMVDDIETLFALRPGGGSTPQMSIMLTKPQRGSSRRNVSSATIVSGVVVTFNSP